MVLSKIVVLLHRIKNVTNEHKNKQTGEKRHATVGLFLCGRIFSRHCIQFSNLYFGNDMKKETYNGWTNYATWRINLEIFDAYEPEQGEEITGQYLEDLCDEIVTEGAPDLCASYARAFLAQVNFHEIAQHINENQQL